MLIVCPQCGYSRDIPAGKVPAKSSMATCPKCQLRFRFREEHSGGAPSPSAPDNEPVYPPKPSRTAASPVPEEPRHAPPTYVSASGVTFQPLPDDVFEPMPPKQPRPAARWLPDPEPAGPGQDDFDAPSPVAAQYRNKTRSAWPEPPERSWAAKPGQAPAFAPKRPARGLEAADQAAEQPSEPQAQPHAQPLGQDGPSPQQSAPAYHTALVFQPSGLDPQAPAAQPLFADADADAAPQPLPPHAGFQPQPGAQPPAGAQPHPDGQPQPAPQPQAAQAPAFQPPAAPPPPPPAPDFWESQDERPANQAATAGDDSVRDIWARLQAMGQPAQADPQAPKAGGAASAQERSHYADSVAPWEQFEHVGVVPAFLKTVQNIIMKPGDFFDGLGPAEGRLRPLLFAMVVCELVAVFWLIWKFFGLGPNFSELGRTEGFQGIGTGGIGSVAMLGLAPVLMIGFSYLDSGISHLLLGLLRGATRPFDDTYRTLCYAGGPWMLALLPIPVQYLAPVVLIWHMTLQAIGLKKCHRSGYAQVLASVLVKWSFFLMAFFAFFVLTMRS